MSSLQLPLGIARSCTIFYICMPNLRSIQILLSRTTKNIPANLNDLYCIRTNKQKTNNNFNNNKLDLFLNLIIENRYKGKHLQFQFKLEL